MRTLDDLDLDLDLDVAGKRVLVRVDFNVPLDTDRMFWNGPMGAFELAPFALPASAGTQEDDQ